MKKRMMACGLLLLMVLSLFSGCKQVDTAGQAATPGKEVVNTPAAEDPKQDTPTVVQPAETEQEDIAEQPEKAEITEKYICKFNITIKDEFVSNNYSENNFGEISVTDFFVETYAYPDEASEACAAKVIITAEVKEWAQVSQAFDRLAARNDIEHMNMTYKAYCINAGSAPHNFKRTTFEHKNDDYTDGLVVVELKDGIAPAPSLFTEFDIDGIGGERYANITGTTDDKIIKLYVKERGYEELVSLTEELKKLDIVVNARLDLIPIMTMD